MSGAYSMVNVPCLARDLSRHPRGAALATDLLRAAALGPDQYVDLDRVRVAVDAPSRRQELAARMALQPRALQVLAATRDVASTSGLEAWTAAVDVLEAAPMGALTDLVDMVRDEICEAAWSRADGLAVTSWTSALDVVTDGVRATYADELCPEIAAPLGRPWRRWLTATSHAPAPVDPLVADVVTAVREMSSGQLSAAAQQLRHQRAEGWSWALAMHDACWAVHLAGRERIALVAQLHAVRALLDAGRPGGERPSPDAVSAVVAAVHARVVSDVLADDVAVALTTPLDSALRQ
ncbi:MAG TPA: hypothetical protein VFJ17_14060 [Mycobacteriales bacterium]|jgi:hypothetical protein|nr:hypothetical protein [Mycobacteriales bacterium]